MKTITKIVFAFCLLCLVMVPIFVWAIAGRSLSDIAAFVAACAAPMGVLTGAMAARGVSRDRQGQKETSARGKQQGKGGDS